MDFFSDYLYAWTSPAYSSDLDNYLMGWNPTLNDNSTEPPLVTYTEFGLVTVCLAIVAAVVFYKVIDRPTFNKWYHWALTGLGAAVISLLYSTGRCVGAVPPDIENVVGEGAYAGFGDFLSLGFVNLVYTFMFFFIFSLIMKNFSTNSRTTPF